MFGMGFIYKRMDMDMDSYTDVSMSRPIESGLSSFLKEAISSVMVSPDRLGQGTQQI
jgi:hypothetical protein